MFAENGKKTLALEVRSFNENFIYFTTTYNPNGERCRGSAIFDLKTNELDTIIINKLDIIYQIFTTKEEIKILTTAYTGFEDMEDSLSKINKHIKDEVFEFKDYIETFYDYSEEKYKDLIYFFIKNVCSYNLEDDEIDYFLNELDLTKTN